MAIEKLLVVKIFQQNMEIYMILFIVLLIILVQKILIIL